MEYQSALYLSGTHAMPRHIEYIINPPGYPVIAIGVSTRPITGKIITGVWTEISIYATLMITKNGSNLRGPRRLDHQQSLALADHLFAVGIQQQRLHAKKWLTRRTGFERRGARQRRQHMRSGLGLPPGINDWTTLLTNDSVVPFPSFGIDRFTHRAEQFQRTARAIFEPLVTAPHQGPNRCRCGIKLGHLMFIDDLPKPRHIRIVGHALKHD